MSRLSKEGRIDRDQLVIVDMSGNVGIGAMIIEKKRKGCRKSSDDRFLCCRVYGITVTWGLRPEASGAELRSGILKFYAQGFRVGG